MVNAHFQTISIHSSRQTLCLADGSNGCCVSSKAAGIGAASQSCLVQYLEQNLRPNSTASAGLTAVTVLPERWSRRKWPFMMWGRSPYARSFESEKFLLISAWGRKFSIEKRIMHFQRSISCKWCDMTHVQMIWSQMKRTLTCLRHLATYRVCHYFVTCAFIIFVSHLDVFF